MISKRQTFINPLLIYALVGPVLGSFVFIAAIYWFLPPYQLWPSGLSVSTAYDGDLFSRIWHILGVWYLGILMGLTYLIGLIPATIAGLLHGTFMLLFGAASRFRQIIRYFWGSVFLGLVLGTFFGYVGIFLTINLLNIGSTIYRIQSPGEFSILSIFAGAICGILSMLVYREKIRSISTK